MTTTHGDRIGDGRLGEGERGEKAEADVDGLEVRLDTAMEVGIEDEQGQGFEQGCGAHSVSKVKYRATARTDQRQEVGEGR